MIATPVGRRLAPAGGTIFENIRSPAHTGYCRTKLPLHEGKGSSVRCEIRMRTCPPTGLSVLFGRSDTEGLWAGHDTAPTMGVQDPRCTP